MRLVLIFLAVGIAIIALRIISALKTAHSMRKELDDTKSAAANAGLAVTSSQTGRALPGGSSSPKFWVSRAWCWS